MKAHEAKAKQDMFKQGMVENVMALPTLEKIILSSSGVSDKNEVKYRAEVLEAISGQKAVLTKVARPEAAFKTRKGWPIGAKVTLRGDKMYYFYEKLVCFVLPRLRDFQGLSQNSFDQHGNYNLGLKDQSCFPEIKYEGMKSRVGMNITIVISNQSVDLSRALLKKMHFPFIQNHQGDENNGK